MMDDRYPAYHDEQPTSTSPLRWSAFILVMILGALVVYIVMFGFPADLASSLVIVSIPMIALALIAACRWAQGRSVRPSTEGDEAILEGMRRHALPAERVGLDTIRCTDCGHSFELVNAKPVDDKVVLCPFCDVRLYVE
jgi:membrane protein implicated in regulation of membrane protease activity